MNKLFLKIILVFLLSQNLNAQNDIKNIIGRMQYLNYHNSLNNLVGIDQDGVKIYASAATKKTNKPEITIFWDEVKIFNVMVKHLPMDTMIKIYERKNNNKELKKWSATCKDLPFENKPYFVNKGMLSGVKIAIDPGHMAGDFETGKIEQKFLEFRANDTTGLTEEVKIVEGILTWQTAMILKTNLEKEGAIVFLTRQKQNHTSFGISYEEWLVKRKKIVLDSLKSINKITIAEHKKYMKLPKEKLFWEFFRDHDLANRIRVINNFKPDLSIIIHYNVDEKNTDWLKPGNKNFTMGFIGGGMTADNFKKTNYKINFLRLLLSTDLDESEKIAGYTVKEFKTQLGVNIANKTDATYLEESCVATKTAGVYCRNLALCRAINSPLVYGECLYQDNFLECQLLNKTNKDYFGIKTNERVKQVADSYLSAIINYYTEK